MMRTGWRDLGVIRRWTVTFVTALAAMTELPADPPVELVGPPLAAQDAHQDGPLVPLDIVNPPAVEHIEPQGGIASIELNCTAWTALGPAPLLNGQTPGGEPCSGRVAGIAGHPTDANTIYVAAAGGGVWKTTNGGTTWLPLTDNQATLFMGSVAVAPSNASVIYAGMGEANNSGDSFYGRGILKSTDAGATWTLTGATNFDRRSIAKIVVHATNPSIAWAAVASGANGVSGNRGIWKTTNGGTTWTNTTVAISTTLSYSDLVIDPTNSNVLYAAVGSSGGSTLNGVYKTTNGGTSWAASGNFPDGDAANGRIALAISRSTPATVYAAVVNASTGALYKMMKTTNSGTTWTQLSATPNFCSSQGWYDVCVAVDPSNANIVYAAGAAGNTRFIKSSDGGANWSDIDTDINGDGPHVDFHTLAFDASGRLLSGNDGGIWRLDNANTATLDWTQINGDLNTIQFTGIAIHSSNLDIAYGGAQDNGTSKFTGSLAWSLLRGGDGGFFRVDRATPATVYHTYQRLGASGTAGSGFLERSDNNGSSWSPKTTGISSSDPAKFYIPYVIQDPANSTRLLLGTNRIYETTNRGDNCAAISTPNVNGWTTAAIVDCIGLAATDLNTIYASAGGQIFVTFDRGATWDLRNASVADNFSDIAVDPTDRLTAYVVRDVFGGPHVFRTIDGGAVWTDISSNLPDLPANAVALDPRGAGNSDDILYLGTDAGVYFSTDLGATWAVFATGLPNAQVVELDLVPALGVLAAGTHGRGLWEIYINGMPTITTHPISQSICTGQPVTFSVAAAGGGLTYRWRRNGVNISGATSPIYSIASVSAASAGNYDCVVTNICGSSFSDVAVLTVGGPPTISTQPVSLTRCAGASATFSVTAGGLAPLMYQWRRNGIDVSGATNASLIISPVTGANGGTYTCIVSNACGSIISSGAVLTVRLVGDANCDGAVNNFDIDAFIVAITSGQAAWQASYPCDFLCANDINRDGIVNNFDIDAFVACITNGGCP